MIANGEGGNGALVLNPVEAESKSEREALYRELNMAEKNAKDKQPDLEFVTEADVQVPVYLLLTPIPINFM